MTKSEVWEEWNALALQEGFKRGKNESVKEGVKEGIEEGIKKGLREAKVDTLLRFLRRIQADLPADLEQAIRGVDDLARLDAIVDVAFSSASIEDFRHGTGL